MWNYCMMALTEQVLVLGFQRIPQMEKDRRATHSWFQPFKVFCDNAFTVSWPAVYVYIYIYIYIHIYIYIYIYIYILNYS